MCACTPEQMQYRRCSLVHTVQLHVGLLTYHFSFQFLQRVVVCILIVESVYCVHVGFHLECILDGVLTIRCEHHFQGTQVLHQLGWEGGHLFISLYSLFPPFLPFLPCPLLLFSLFPSPHILSQLSRSALNKMIITCIGLLVSYIVLYHPE